MAVYEHTYRSYDGPLTPVRWRFLVPTRYAYERVFGSRIFLAYFLLSFLPAAVGAILIYLRHNLTAIEMLHLQAVDVAKMFPIDSTFFLAILSFESGLAGLLALFMGPALISPDLVNNAMPLYLSRPFSRGEYILGKFCVLAILMSALTWVPCLLLFGFQSCLEGWSWFAENLFLAKAVVLASAVWIVVLVLMTMAASAWVKRKPIAAAFVLAFYFLSKGMGSAINEIYRTVWGGLIDLGGLTTSVWADLFGIPGVSRIPIWTCWTSLLVFCGLCLWVLTRKVRAYAVVR